MKTVAGDKICGLPPRLWDSSIEQPMLNCLSCWFPVCKVRALKLILLSAGQHLSTQHLSAYVDALMLRCLVLQLIRDCTVRHLLWLCHRRWGVGLQSSFVLVWGIRHNWQVVAGCHVHDVTGLLSEAEQHTDMPSSVASPCGEFISVLNTFDGELTCEVEEGLVLQQCPSHSCVLGQNWHAGLSQQCL